MNSLSTMVYVVLPAYNEGEQLVTLVGELHKALSPNRFEIVLVDDGSSDNSIDLVRASQFDVSIVQHPQNMGLGEAMRTGLTTAIEKSKCDSDIVVVMDSDCTHTPYLIDRMIGLIKEGNDVVIASRYRYGSRVIGLALYRVILSHASSMIFRVFQPIPGVRDYTCGFRAYKAGLLRKAFQLYKSEFVSETGFSCMVDILIKLSKMGAIMSEVPMILRYDRKLSSSKMKIMKTIFATLGLLVRCMKAGDETRQPSLESAASLSVAEAQPTTSSHAH